MDTLQDKPKPMEALLVEDDEADVLMTREAFEFCKIRDTLHVVTDPMAGFNMLGVHAPGDDYSTASMITSVASVDDGVA